MLTQEVPFKGLLGVQVAWVVVQEEEVNERDFVNPKIFWNLTFCSLISVCNFSILIFLHFLRWRQGEYVKQSRASLVGDHFPYSHDLNVWFRGDIVGRNYMLVTLRSQRVKEIHVDVGINIQAIVPEGHTFKIQPQTAPCK